LDLANAFKYLVEGIIVPLARSMRSAVEAAISDFEPDAMLVDHHALAGAIAARKASIAWATSAPSAQLFTDVLDDLERVRAWVQGLYAEVQSESGLEPVDSPDCSPHLVLLYTTPELVGEHIEFPPHYRFVGATIRGRVDAPEFPWEELRKGRKVLVSLGSLVSQRGERFFRVLQEALGDTDLQVIVSAPPGLLPNPPANFLVREWVPQLKLLPEVDAVVTHGGSTVNEALAFAVPMVVAPITNDQFIFARCVAESGAGIRVRFRRVTPAELREAVVTVIDDPSYAEAARRIQFSYAQAGGTHAAADSLEALVASGRPD
jgi:MGT family glycosyltransferase